MKIRWSTPAVIVFGVVALMLFAQCKQAIAAFVSKIGRIGPNHTADEQTLGLIALGLIGTCIVAIVRIVTRN